MSLRSASSSRATPPTTTSISILPNPMCRTDRSGSPRSARSNRSSRARSSLHISAQRTTTTRGLSRRRGNTSATSIGSLKRRRPPRSSTTKCSRSIQAGSILGGPCGARRVRSNHRLETPMSSTKTAGNTTATTQFLQANGHSYAYRRFGGGSGLPLLFLQHFTGTLDNWDPAVTDPLASGREVILFDNAGLGRSTGEVPHTVAEMAGHAVAFLDGLGIKRCDVLGYSLGGMVGLQMVQNRPSLFRRMILVGNTTRGGEDIMHLEKPSLAKHLHDPTNPGYDVLNKTFFTSSRLS